jgi:hypothetical protein
VGVTTPGSVENSGALKLVELVCFEFKNMLFSALCMNLMVVQLNYVVFINY